MSLTNVSKTDTDTLSAKKGGWGFGIAFTLIWPDDKCEFFAFWLCKSAGKVSPYNPNIDYNSTWFYIENNKLTIDVYVNDVDMKEVLSKNFEDNKLELKNDRGIPFIELPVELVEKFNLRYDKIYPGKYDAVVLEKDNRIKIIIE